ncbi:MAG TPA: 2-dehydropantoate 2-reductase [Anaerolineaceae bacterium]|nr:2-dehydropantoate 2-reductase [Anaerolineaceae bacterium]
MEILCFGAGAIGAYIGGSLAAAGHKVVFLERPEGVKTLREQGLRLDLGEQKHHITDGQFAGSLAEAMELGPFDVAIFALKAFDTDQALRDMQPFTHSLPPLLCLQNGVENEAKIAAVFGWEKVIRGSVTSAVGRRGLGDIHLERKRGIGVAADHSLSARLVQALNEAGLNAQPYTNGAAMKWSKMLTNLIANATSAILDMTPAQVFADPRLYHIEICQLRETLAVMKSMGLPVVDLPGTPVRALAFGAGLPEPLARPLMTRAIGRGRGGKMPSFHIDLHGGRGKSEVDYLNGAVARFGAQFGISTPVNRVLNETLQELTDHPDKIPEYTGHPELLIKRIGS